MSQKKTRNDKNTNPNTPSQALPLLSRGQPLFHLHPSPRAKREPFATHSGIRRRKDMVLQLMSLSDWSLNLVTLWVWLYECPIFWSHTALAEPLFLHLRCQLSHIRHQAEISHETWAVWRSQHKAWKCFDGELFDAQSNDGEWQKTWYITSSV